MFYANRSPKPWTFQNLALESFVHDDGPQRAGRICRCQGPAAKARQLECVEEVAMSHGGLLECAVVGVPDKHSGEVGKLFAVRKRPDVTAEDLRAFLAARLASYKMPKQIEFRDELPKTNVGKILRRALRDEPSQPAAN